MTQRQTVLEMLQRGPVTNGQFAAAGILRFGARLKELRDAGYSITTHGSEGTVTYRLQNTCGGGSSPAHRPSPVDKAPASTRTCVIRTLDGEWIDKAPLPEWAKEAA